MKNSIGTLLDSYVSDNSSFIAQNEETAAEYILRDTEAWECGWHWFLSDEEIEEFENDSARAEELVQEIKNYVNSNYDYEISE